MCFSFHRAKRNVNGKRREAEPCCEMPKARMLPYDDRKAEIAEKEIPNRNTTDNGRNESEQKQREKKSFLLGRKLTVWF